MKELPMLRLHMHQTIALAIAMKNAKDFTDMKLCFWTNEVIPMVLLAKNLLYLVTVSKIYQDISPQVDAKAMYSR